MIMPLFVLLRLNISNIYKCNKDILIIYRATVFTHENLSKYVTRQMAILVMPDWRQNWQLWIVWYLIPIMV